jgi:hypothetical protein
VACRLALASRARAYSLSCSTKSSPFALLAMTYM